MVRLSFHLITIEEAWLYIFRFCCFTPVKNSAVKRKKTPVKSMFSTIQVPLLITP